MRYQSSVTSLSWIPSEAIQGGTRLPFDVGMAHYDQAPPDQIDDLDALRTADRFRFANRLAASIQVNASGEIIGASYTGAGMIGSTTVKLGPVSKVFEAVALPDIQMKPVYGDGWVRFTQTAGGRTGHARAAPRATRARSSSGRRRSRGRRCRSRCTPTATPRGRSWAPVASHVTGSTTTDGQLSAKSGLIDFNDWYRKSFGKQTPWGHQDSDAFVTTVETALERNLSHKLMAGRGQT